MNDKKLCISSMQSFSFPVISVPTRIKNGSWLWWEGVTVWSRPKGWTGSTTVLNPPLVEVVGYPR